jgi:hypothetical protein
MNLSSDFALSLIFIIQVCPCEAELMSRSGVRVVNAESSSDETQQCPICLNTFSTQEVGTPNSCNHIFCCTCLHEWSKVSVTLKEF